jgi:hypothetical protein
MFALYHASDGGDATFMDTLADLSPSVVCMQGA